MLKSLNHPRKVPVKYTPRNTETPLKNGSVPAPPHGHALHGVDQDAEADEERDVERQVVVRQRLQAEVDDGAVAEDLARTW